MTVLHTEYESSWCVLLLPVWMVQFLLLGLINLHFGFLLSCIITQCVLHFRKGFANPRLPLRKVIHLGASSSDKKFSCTWSRVTNLLLWRISAQLFLYLFRPNLCALYSKNMTSLWPVFLPSGMPIYLWRNDFLPAVFVVCLSCLVLGLQKVWNQPCHIQAACQTSRGTHSSEMYSWCSFLRVRNVPLSSFVVTMSILYF